MQPTIAHRDSSPAGRCPRRAFTLIELLIVLALIGILAGLLLGPVLGVFGGARVTQVTAEIANLDKAIQECKLRLGVEPPSFIRLYENPMDWTTNAAVPVVRRSRALIQRIWSDYNFTASQDINGDGDSTDTINLQSTEALLFFLAGNGILNTTNPQPLGFSANPVNPFASGGTRVGPFYEFDTSRLSDVDQDGIPEYRDPIPGQVLPYLYFSSYDGAGYQPWGGDTDGMGGVYGDADDEVLKQGASGSDLIDGLYLINDAQWPNMGGTTGGRPQASPVSNYINAKSYQILSPGQDFDFGAGGTYIRGKGLATFTAAADTYRSPDARRAEFDNITNFSGGVLGETTFVAPVVP